MQKRLIWLLLFYPFLSFCQSLEGIVVDSLQKPIPFANVQLIEKNTFKSVFFSQTNDDGQFSINCKTIDFPVVLKITHLSFEKEEIEINNCDKIQLTLKSKTTLLKEIILEQNVFDVVEQNDTLKYNLKKLLNGSENKLKDIIEKLPGLSIDENGKIRYNGKKIDHLLLDGDDFYNDQHQLATENLTPEMIEKIELLKNYQDLSSIKGFENSGATALNIGLNEKFKDIVRGNVEAEGGYKEKYKLNANTFNFGKKLKYNLLLNTNNINKNVFTINDFLNIKKSLGSKKLSESSGNSEIIQEEDLPEFIFSTDLIKDKTVKNYTFNLSQKQNNKKVDFFSVLNKINQNEFTNGNQIFFDCSPSVLKHNTIGGVSLYSTNILKFENKINEQKYFSINSYLILNKDIQESYINNQILTMNDETIFENDLVNKHLKLGFNSKYKNKLSEKILLETTLIGDYSNVSNNLNIASTKLLTQFDSNENWLTQKNNYNSFFLGAKGSLVVKLNSKNSLNLGLKSITSNEALQNRNTLQESYIFSTNFQTTENCMLIKYNSKINKFFKYSAGIDFVSKNYSINSVNDKFFIVLPSAEFLYSPSKNLNFGIFYNVTKSDYSVYQMANGKIIQDYRTLTQKSNLTIEKIRTNNLQFNTSYSKPTANIFSFLNISYSQLPKSINKAFDNNNQLTKEQYIFSDLNKSLYMLFFGEKKFNKIPIGFNIESLNSVFKKATYINEIRNVNENSQNKITVEAKSYFEKNNFNLATGFEYLSSKNNNQTNNITNSYKQYSPYLKFNGEIFKDKVYWETKTTLHKFETSSTAVDDIYDIGFLLKYDLRDFNFYLSGSNILNISENNTKNSINYNQVFAEETIISSFSGFVNLGISFSF
ncbi:MAG: hypothetical protein IE891_02985 [Flavobacteriaceae bacterium]|nr:hypothetical protein [Flavobacteriaceae bacterium]